MSILNVLNSAVWGIPLLILIAGVGGYLTIKTGFGQFRLLPTALKQFFKKEKSVNKTSQNRALSTALAATVGTGNLAGVAGAICIGGPGTVFWIWVCGFLGMITKCAEATLAVNFRYKNEKGENVGGPMYMIRGGMPKYTHWLAGVYSFLGVVASFGVGNASQINAIIGSVRSVFSGFDITISNATVMLFGLALAGFVYYALSAGVDRIGRMTERIIPFAAVVYILLGSIFLIVNHERVLIAFRQIILGAFCPSAVTCGAITSSFLVLRTGAARGTFTNEAGMGTASIAHAAADVEHPVQQGLMGIVEVFVDTILICTMTALVILCSNTQIPYGNDAGIELTISAFSDLYGVAAGIIMAVLVLLFALATILGWSLYGGRCVQYLFGEGCWKPYICLQTVVVLISVLLRTDTVWVASEILNGLMAIPNLFTLVWLSPVFINMFKEYNPRSQ